MKNLLKRVGEISKKYEQLNKISGNSFNVFEVINVTSDEVRLHSKFIASLLDPKGTHGQDDLFLKLFTNQLQINIDTATASVFVEKYIGEKIETTGGYIDVFIDDKKGNSITIENKIYAPDQENQLLRYYNYSSKNLLYLNLDGSEPSENSTTVTNESATTKSKKTKLILNKDYRIISYKEDILNWLLACRKEAVELPLLREGISHYINLIKILTGQSVNSKMNKEISEHITSSSENLKNAALVQENMTAVKIDIQWRFWEKLKEKLKEKNLILVNDKNVTWQNVKNYYSKSRNRDIHYGFWVKIFEKDNISIHFGIEIVDEIYFGFTMERNGKGGIALNDENKEWRNLVSNLNEDYKATHGWLGHRYLKEKLNFRAFNSKEIFELADRKKLDHKVDAIVKDMLIDINQLKTKLEDINQNSTAKN